MSDGGDWSGSCDDVKRKRRTNASADYGSLPSRTCKRLRSHERNARDLATNSLQSGRKNGDRVRSDSNLG